MSKFTRIDAFRYLELFSNNLNTLHFFTVKDKFIFNCEKATCIITFNDRVYLKYTVKDFFDDTKAPILSPNEEDIVNEVINKSRNFVGSIFYIEPKKILNFLDKYYNSTAKLKKVYIKFTIMEDSIHVECIPRKRSTSVFKRDIYIDIAFVPWLAQSVAIDDTFKIPAFEFREILNNTLNIKKYCGLEFNERENYIKCKYSLDKNNAIEWLINKEEI